MTNILIIHYNTPELTQALVKSIYKHVPEPKIHIFDNSDANPIAVSDNIVYYDNTKGAYIDFNKELEKYPNHVKSPGKFNKWGSAKHAMSVQKCLEMIDEPLVLLDSDVLLIRDVTPLIDESAIYAGETLLQPGVSNIHRVSPFCCYINAPMMKALNVKYFDPNYMHGLSVSAEADRWDTGGALWHHTRSIKHTDIKATDYMIHYKGGSWENSHNARYNVQMSSDEWLAINRRLYEDIPPIEAFILESGCEKLTQASIDSAVKYGFSSRTHVVTWHDHKYDDASSTYIDESNLNNPDSVLKLCYESAGNRPFIIMKGSRLLRRNAECIASGMRSWVGEAGSDGIPNLSFIYIENEDSPCTASELSHKPHRDADINAWTVECGKSGAETDLWISLHSHLRNNHKRCVYTCITGGYDAPIYLSDYNDDTDYICFTDSPSTAMPFWEPRPVPSELRHLSPVKQQRIIKICPHKYLKEYDESIWIDGNIDVCGDIDGFLSRHRTSAPVIMYKHPARNCVYDEAREIIALHKDSRENVDPQMSLYRAKGYPAHNGMVQSNIMYRRHNDPMCMKLMDAWAEEMLTHPSHRDQLSFNYSLWKCNLGDYTDIIEEDLSNSEWFKNVNARHSKSAARAMRRPNGVSNTTAAKALRSMKPKASGRADCKDDALIKECMSVQPVCPMKIDPASAQGRYVIATFRASNSQPLPFIDKVPGVRYVCYAPDGVDVCNGWEPGRMIGSDWDAAAMAFGKQTSKCCFAMLMRAEMCRAVTAKILDVMSSVTAQGHRKTEFAPATPLTRKCVILNNSRPSNTDGVIFLSQLYIKKVFIR